MSKNKTEQNGSKEDEKQEEFEEVEFVPPTPPDGGWGWGCHGCVVLL
jgi:hypothetical protein